MDLKKNIVFDAIIGILYLAVANPAITGIAFHEWAALGLIVLFVAHTAFHGSWCVQTVRSLTERRRARGRLSFALDVLLTAVIGVVAASGIMLSRNVLFSLNLVAQGYFTFVTIHAVAAKLLLILIIIHVVMHVRQIRSVRAPRPAENKKNPAEHA